MKIITKEELLQRIETLEQQFKRIQEKLDKIYFESSYSTEIIPDEAELILHSSKKD